MENDFFSFYGSMQKTTENRLTANTNIMGYLLCVRCVCASMRFARLIHVFRHFFQTNKMSWYYWISNVDMTLLQIVFAVVIVIALALENEMGRK